MTGRRRVTCVPMVTGTSVALVRGSFTDEEVEAYTAEAREFARRRRAAGVSDPPATVPGATGTDNPGRSRTMTSANPLNIENAPETGGDKFTNAEHENDLIVLTVKGTGKDTFDNGEAEFIIADITVVEPDPANRESSAGDAFEDAWVFGRVLFGQLKRKVGRTFVGRIVKGQAQKGKSAPWQLDPVSQEETQRAVAFMTAHVTEQHTPEPARGGAPAEGPAPTELADDTPPWARK